MQVEFAEDVCHVALNRSPGQEELFGDSRIGLSQRYERGDPLLSRGEARPAVSRSPPVARLPASNATGAQFSAPSRALSQVASKAAYNSKARVLGAAGGFEVAACDVGKRGGMERLGLRERPAEVAIAVCGPC